MLRAYVLFFSQVSPKLAAVTSSGNGCAMVDPLWWGC